MSWKGIQKSVVRVRTPITVHCNDPECRRERPGAPVSAAPAAYAAASAPQNFRQKFNIGEQTKDAVFIDAERRFRELEIATKKLHDESEKYYQAINSMLSHQIEFSKAIEEIYNPISGRVSDPNAAIPEGNPEGIAACEQYRDIVSALQTELQPELEMLDTRIVKPADELLEIVKHVRKLIVKRSHKQVDLDRHQNSLKKLQDKKDRSLKEEKNMYKVESDFEIAQQEYNYYNDMLKEDLPKMFFLETEFIKPLFKTFYYMQLNIFYTLYDKMKVNDISYFNMSSEVDIETAFNTKRGNIQEIAEAIPLTKFNINWAKKKGMDPRLKRPPGAAGTAGALGTASSPPPYGQNTLAYEYQQQQQLDYAASGQPAPYGAAPAGAAYQNPASPAVGYPPAYQVSGATGVAGAAPSYAAAVPNADLYAGYPAEKTPASTAPVAGAPAGAVEHCVALYDYNAQAEGDLTFKAGERIEIVQRTADPNGWWTGRVNGYQGVFPGNYVALQG
ncbi:BAR domain-containing protein [Limtongia smithiae]|uniref:BAR domain-containing protein n=1 Tax=Limtongia smithiae TaxID=1125753 RepID=UPI0034CE58B3